MFSLISTLFKRTTAIIENDLKEVVIHSLDAIFCKEHVINMEYARYNSKNIENV